MHNTGSSLKETPCAFIFFSIFIIFFFSIRKQQPTAVSSPREALQQAFTNHIIDTDPWMQMLHTKNQPVHDYDCTFAAEKSHDIINVYYPLFERQKNDTAKYCKLP